MPEETTWLTPDAHRKLQEELNYLITEGRRQLQERIAEARTHGDIRENSDYDSAKNDQGLMEARIRHIEHLLRTAQIRDVEETEVVVVGSLVTVRDDEGEETEYLVAPTENKVPGYLLASPAGPLGRALLGTRAGDQVTYDAPGGSFSVRVLGVRPYRG